MSLSTFRGSRCGQTYLVNLAPNGPHDCGIRDCVARPLDEVDGLRLEGEQPKIRRGHPGARIALIAISAAVAGILLIAWLPEGQKQQPLSVRQIEQRIHEHPGHPLAARWRRILRMPYMYRNAPKALASVARDFAAEIRRHERIRETIREQRPVAHSLVVLWTQEHPGNSLTQSWYNDPSDDALGQVIQELREEQRIWKDPCADAETLRQAFVRWIAANPDHPLSQNFDIKHEFELSVQPAGVYSLFAPDKTTVVWIGSDQAKALFEEIYKEFKPYRKQWRERYERLLLLLKPA